MNSKILFWFIRHAESEGNAGLPTTSAGGIPLTDLGKKQANNLSQEITQAPDLFVISPYIRTQQTAAPTLEKFPDVPVETWEIQEYTYLPHELHKNTTTAQRNKPAVEYFRKADADLVLGDGAESFVQMIARVDKALERVSVSPQNEIILFSHGWFVRAILWRLIFLPGYGNKITMNSLKEKLPQTGLLYALFTRFAKEPKKPLRHFLLFSAVFSLPNTSIIKFEFDRDNDSIELISITSEHIPPELRNKHIGNR